MAISVSCSPRRRRNIPHDLHRSCHNVRLHASDNRGGYRPKVSARTSYSLQVFQQTVEFHRIPVVCRSVYNLSLLLRYWRMGSEIYVYLCFVQQQGGCCRRGFRQFYKRTMGSAPVHYCLCVALLRYRLSRSREGHREVLAHNNAVAHSPRAVHLPLFAHNIAYRCQWRYPYGNRRSDNLSCPEFRGRYVQALPHDCSRCHRPVVLLALHSHGLSVHLCQLL